MKSKKFNIFSTDRIFFVLLAAQAHAASAPGDMLNTSRVLWTRPLLGVRRRGSRLACTGRKKGNAERASRGVKIFCVGGFAACRGVTQPGEGDRKVSSRVPSISVEAWLAEPGYPCAPRPWELVVFWRRVTQSFSEWGLPSRLGPNLKPWCLPGRGVRE